MNNDAHSVHQPHQRCFCVVNPRICFAILVEEIQTRPQVRTRGRRGKMARGNTHVYGCTYVCCIRNQVLFQVSATCSGGGADELRKQIVLRNHVFAAQNLVQSADKWFRNVRTGALRMEKVRS